MAHRTLATRGAVVGLLLVLTACTGADGGPDDGSGAPAARTAPAPTAPSEPLPTATPTPTTPLPDVPVRPADLDALVVEAVVPPVDLRVPDLDITVPVDPVGVTADGQMEIPPHAERSGWYRFGPSPADGAGTVVVAAHVDSIASAGLGPFARLHDAQEGTEVRVTLDDGTTHTYRVTEVRQVAKAEAEWQPVFTRDGSPRLVLVTCGGTFRPDEGRYSDNVVVVAEHVGG